MVERRGYGALTTDVVAEDGQAIQMRTDGHGRVVETRRTADADTIVWRAVYQVLGEPAVIVRSHAGGADQVVRWMYYDSMGRLVQNAEPNTATGFTADPGAAGAMHAWRYAYDDAGQLVGGTSDARGCGKNLHTTTSGGWSRRTTPRASAQELYSEFDPAAGTGAEVRTGTAAPSPDEPATLA